MPNDHFARNKQLWKSTLAVCEKCPYSELLCSVFSRIRTEYGEIRFEISVFSATAGK